MGRRRGQAEDPWRHAKDTDFKLISDVILDAVPCCCGVSAIDDGVGVVIVYVHRAKAVSAWIK